MARMQHLWLRLCRVLLPVVLISSLLLLLLSQNEVTQPQAPLNTPDNIDAIFVEQKDMAKLLKAYIDGRRNQVFGFQRIPERASYQSRQDYAKEDRGEVTEEKPEQLLRDESEKLVQLSRAQEFAAKYGLERVEDKAILSTNQVSFQPCFGDCTEFQKVLSEWPKSKPTAAFYYLTQKPRLKWLKKSLEYLDDNFNDEYHYPVIIFHEMDLRPFLDHIRTFTRSSIYFQEIRFTIPMFLSKSIQFNIPCISSVSYRKMCRFHAKEVYEQPIIENLAYLFRLDDDSFITRPIHYDVFKYMRTRDIMYGYIWPHYDAMSCTEGLWEATEHFINVTGIQPHFFSEWTRPKLYYNNFEISRTDIWMSTAYRAYVNYLDLLGGMFYHRWGDAPIKSLAVSMLVPKNKTHHFSDIGYTHSSFQN